MNFMAHFRLGIDRAKRAMARCLPDPRRCRYSDCPERHPLITEADEDRVRVSCDTCRRSMGLPSDRS